MPLYSDNIHMKSNKKTKKQEKRTKVKNEKEKKQKMKMSLKYIKINKNSFEEFCNNYSYDLLFISCCLLCTSD